MTSTAIKPVIDEAIGNADAQMLTNDMLWCADTSALRPVTWPSVQEQKGQFNAKSVQGERSGAPKATDDTVSPWRRCLHDMFTDN